MKDHEIAQKINDLTGIAQTYRVAQQLRERIKYCIHDELKELQRLRDENASLRKANNQLQLTLVPLQQENATLRAKNRGLIRDNEDANFMLRLARTRLEAYTKEGREKDE